MIQVVFNGPLGRETYVVSLRGASLTEETFLKRAGVRSGSYAGNLISGIYESLFDASLDLKTDFDKYYLIEYGSFGEYLRKRHLLHREDIKEIEGEYPAAEAILYWNHAPSLLEDGVGEKLLRRIVEPEEKQ